MAIRILARLGGDEWEIRDRGRQHYALEAKLEPISVSDNLAYRRVLRDAGFRFLCGIAPKVSLFDDLTVAQALAELYKISPNATDERWGRKVIGPCRLSIGVGVWVRP